MNSINEQKVSLKKVKHAKNDQLSNNVCYECSFCNKTVKIHACNMKACENLTNNGSFYCPFCLRHSLNTKNSRDILTLSFRAVVGALYYGFYLGKTQPLRAIWFSELKDYIQNHIEVGLQNPLFSYDHETMLWLVNFSKVGRGKKKTSLDTVLITVSEMLNCFKLNKYFSEGNVQIHYAKYKEAIEKFYSHRTRPPDRKFLIPTLTCMNETNKFKLESTRNFSSKKLILKY